MYEKYKIFSFEDNHGEFLLNESADLKVPRETGDHREEPTEDALVEFVYEDRDIFLQDSLTDSQLEHVVKASKASTPADSVVPPRDPETAKALEPSNLD